MYFFAFTNWVAHSLVSQWWALYSFLFCHIFSFQIILVLRKVSVFVSKTDIGDRFCNSLAKLLIVIWETRDHCIILVIRAWWLRIRMLLIDRMIGGNKMTNKKESTSSCQGHNDGNNMLLCQLYIIWRISSYSPGEECSSWFLEIDKWELLFPLSRATRAAF